MPLLLMFPSSGNQYTHGRADGGGEAKFFAKSSAAGVTPVSAQSADSTNMDCFFIVPFSFHLVHFASRRSATCNVTGPISPEGMSAASLVNLRMLVFVNRLSDSNEASPMMRLGQKLTTSTSSTLSLGFTTSVMSTRSGGVQTMPSERPLRRTSASSRRSPRSKRIRDLEF